MTLWMKQTLAQCLTATIEMLDSILIELEDSIDDELEDRPTEVAKKEEE